LVFSTLHTNSAAGALPRLLDMRAEPFLIASTITCVMAQRVLRKICDRCRESFAPTEELVLDVRAVLDTLAPSGSFVLFRGKGCPECNDTGYLGRIGIFEVLSMDEKIERLVLERRPASDIERHAKENGMLLMKQDGYLKALEGITTVEEVLRVAQI
jgi:type II secretory ATPase GspE/PulE/Tfp pilus assembly ATPase PilB-like protein